LSVQPTIVEVLERLSLGQSAREWSGLGKTSRGQQKSNGEHAEEGTKRVTVDKLRNDVRGDGLSNAHRATMLLLNECMRPDRECQQPGITGELHHEE
jgi:hypothetical protein